MKNVLTWHLQSYNKIWVSQFKEDVDKLRMVLKRSTRLLKRLEDQILEDRLAGAIPECISVP